jgi:hypothetical protein
MIGLRADSGSDGIVPSNLAAKIRLAWQFG